MTFAECVAKCSVQPSFVAEYERLTGNRLLPPRTTPIEALVDEATGASRERIAKFAAFVYEVVWTRLPPEPEP